MIANDLNQGQSPAGRKFSLPRNASAAVSPMTLPSLSLYDQTSCGNALTSRVERHFPDHGRLSSS